MVPSPDGRPYTAKAISQKAAALGFKLGESYLSQLRSGKAKSPSFRTVEGIAAAFGVDIHFFLTRDARERTREQIHLMRLHSDPNVFAAAFRHADLAPDAAGLVDDLVRVLREQQGLPPEPDLPAQ
ncbi:helix-turn-helix domain-containing protein [Tsukamurella sp. 8F]|uniref:helix-turn-helix domain-containing protein n=1 Tax=unclassified Tsukamurella TaxID=2633480 RepID=UPI0023B8ADD8|nr:MULTISPECIES: helix-turn-helix domain-containing protein [unclassified Tsukamurella]MDF0531406.1 helix-turn-helix domain-containing protein [Tsukamurella sp. 8J]MDF0585288.1 helix-turn-helix domain-containing protein [Tsukamurella sp. 8F]